MNMMNYKKFINELQDVVNKIVMAKSKKFGRNLIQDTTEQAFNNKTEKKIGDVTYSLPFFEVQP